jgi:lysophospholipase L1-like esterase
MVQRSGTGPDGGAPQIVLVAPPPVGDTSRFGGDDPAYAGSELSWAGAIERSKQFAAQYARVAAAYGCGFFDAGSVVATSALDGIHWNAGGHRAFGEALAEALR